MKVQITYTLLQGVRLTCETELTTEIVFEMDVKCMVDAERIVAAMHLIEPMIIALD